MGQIHPPIISRPSFSIPENTRKRTDPAQRCIVLNGRKVLQVFITEICSEVPLPWFDAWCQDDLSRVRLFNQAFGMVVTPIIVGNCRRGYSTASAIYKSITGRADDSMLAKCGSTKYPKRFTFHLEHATAQEVFRHRRGKVLACGTGTKVVRPSIF